MKRIVIIEGNVSSLSHHCEEYTAIISRDKAEIVLDITPEAADQIGASFREPMRVVVEIGTGESPTQESSGDPLYRGKPRAQLTREELIHALAHARHAADEYQRENEALVKSNEGLQADFDAMVAKNDELMCELAASRRTADDSANCANELTEQLRARDSVSAFDPQKHITKATVAKWLEAGAAACDRAPGSTGSDAVILDQCAAHIRKIIDRINATKETP